MKLVEELLTNGDIGQEVANKLNNEWATHTSKLNAENKTLREEKESLSKNYEEVFKSKSDLDEQLKGLDEKIVNAKKDGQMELARELEAEKASKDQLQKSLDSLQSANTSLQLDSAVSKAMGGYDVKKEDREIVQFYLRSKVSMVDDNVRYNSDGDYVPVDEAFKSYFIENSSRLNSVGNGGGSGSRDGGGRGGQNTKSRDDFEKLNPGQRADFMSKGGTVT